MTETSRTFPVPSVSYPKWDEGTKRYVVDALGVTAWDESYGQTLGYRWRGEDTLTWGNADDWILIKWLIKYFFSQENENVSVLGQQQVILWLILYEARIAKLKTIYTFRNGDDIRQFLLDHRSILSVLWEARPVVEEFFGNDVSVDLEVVNDPEASHSKQLFGYIGTASLSPEEAFERLNAFDEVWFLKQFDLTGGLFNFNLE
jgi:hypothetical protein